MSSKKVKWRKTMDEARIVEASGAKEYGTQESKLKLSKVQSAGMAAAMAALVISLCLPANVYLTKTGIKTVGILVAFLIMLVTEALPVVVTSLIFCGLMPVTGVTPDLGMALTGYSEPIVFFTLASFGGYDDHSSVEEDPPVYAESIWQRYQKRTIYRNGGMRAFFLHRFQRADLRDLYGDFPGVHKGV